MQYNRARWYDANLGRFISEDPIGFAGGINQYGYVKNSPLNFTDSLGLVQDGPTNYLRDPMSPEHWIINGLSNSISDLLGLDAVAQWSWTAGDYRCSTSDRVGAGAKLVGWTAFQAFGGYAAGKIFGAAFKALRPLIGRMPNTTLLNEGGIYAFGLKNNVVDFAENLGANHLMNDPSWKSTFAEIINNSANEIHFNLNGIDEPIMKMINSPSRSGINWEMHQLYQSPAFENTTFYFGENTYIGFSVFQVKP